MYRDHDDLGWLAGALALLLFLAVLAAVIVGLVLLLRRRRGLAAGPGARPVGGPAAWAASSGSPVAAAEQTLAERLARGEIDVVDYEQRLAALRRSQTPGDLSADSPPPAPPGSPPGYPS